MRYELSDDPKSGHRFSDKITHQRYQRQFT